MNWKERFSAATGRKILSYEDADWGISEGEYRYRWNKENGGKNKYGKPVDPVKDLHDSKMGALGELVLARALEVEWDPKTTPSKDPDVPPFHVRTRSEIWHELYFRPDEQDGFYALIHMLEFPAMFNVSGMISDSSICRRKEWLKPHGGRTPAYFIPHKRMECWSQPEEPWPPLKPCTFYTKPNGGWTLKDD